MKLNTRFLAPLGMTVRSGYSSWNAPLQFVIPLGIPPQFVIPLGIPPQFVMPSGARTLVLAVLLLKNNDPEYVILSAAKDLDVGC